jgi:small-conductance mechanosensitive channel
VKNAEAQREEFRLRYEQVKKDMIALKRSLDMEKEQTLEKQAKELESLKNEMRLKEARDAERREFEAMRNQFATMTERLNTQAQAEQAAKDKKSRFGGSKTSGGVETDKTIYFDDFARKMESPKKDFTA